VKRHFQILLVFYWLLIQIPVMPMVSFLVAELDGSHQVSLKKEHGLAVLRLKHRVLPHQHTAAMDLLLRVATVNDQERDHQIQFSHVDENFEPPVDDWVLRVKVHAGKQLHGGNVFVFPLHGNTDQTALEQPVFVRKWQVSALGLRQIIMMI
jgi:septum formation inhibitor MinC